MKTDYSPEAIEARLKRACQASMLGRSLSRASIERDAPGRKQIDGELPASGDHTEQIATHLRLEDES